MTVAAVPALKPAVVLAPFDAERDAAALAKVRVLAFSETEVNHRMWPAPAPSVEDQVRYNLRSYSRTYISPETVRITALVDGAPVGFAIYSSPVDRTATAGEPTAEEAAAEAERERANEASKEDIDREAEKRCDYAFVKRFKKAMADKRKERFKGRKFWLLELLVIDPEFQGLGLGKKLMQWGFARADRDHLPLYLEATPAGEPVYKRYNFSIVDTVYFEDNDGVRLSLPAMERPPAPFSGELPPPSEEELMPTVDSNPAKADNSKRANGQHPPREEVQIALVEDADWPEVVRTKLLAFEDDLLAETTAPRHLRPDFETRVEWAVHTQRQTPKDTLDNYAYLKAFFPSNPSLIVGHAAWEKPRYPTEAKPDPVPSDKLCEHVKGDLDALIDAATNTEFVKEVKTAMRESREGYHKGAPHWYLASLVVHPDYQGYGIARKLIAWATDQADAANLPCHLESSPIGEKIYPRYGFEVVQQLPWTHISGRKLTSPSMCRPPQAAQKVEAA